MLLELRVTNFAIIENLQIPFKPGLNIISGETGAGKSILLKSLSLLMGAKSSSDTVRNGFDTATIEGAFDLSERSDILFRLKDLAIDSPEDTLVVRRIISRQGKSKVYLNGVLSALNSLRDIVSPLIEVTGHDAPLIEMTGQHENRQLQSKSYHLDLLDSFAGVWKLRKEVSSEYQRLNTIQKNIEQLEGESRHRNQRLDFLNFQKKELEEIPFTPGDESNLESKLNRIKNSSRLLDYISSSESQLYSAEDSILSTLHRIISKGNEVSNLDSSLKAKIEPLEQAKAYIEESVFELRSYEQEFETSEEGMAEAEEKLSHLRKLQKKYGSSIEDILSELEKVKTEIHLLEGSDEAIEQLQKEKDSCEDLLFSLSSELHTRRVKAAKVFSKQTNLELLDLNMKGLEFAIQIKKMKTPFPTGITDLSFVTRSGNADTYRPLTKFASGGELSRILLSLKRIVGRSDKPCTFLFDEVDTGVSGTTAEKVGRKLHATAVGQQVICVTHLPQVAAFADSHYFIHKTPTSSSASMEVVELSGEKRVGEIARLISGEKITKTSLDHATQLIKETQAEHA